MFESPLQLQRTAIVVVCLLTAMTQPCHGTGSAVPIIQKAFGTKKPVSACMPH